MPARSNKQTDGPQTQCGGVGVNNIKIETVGPVSGQGR